MSRLRGLIAFIGGVVVIFLGIAMWRSPEVNWEGFLEAWSLTISEIARLIDDPFAVLGIVIVIIGFLVAVSGLKRIVLRQK